MSAQELADHLRRERQRREARESNLPAFAASVVPMCWVCKKEVQYTEETVDVMTQNHIITVECHGRRETMVLSCKDVQDSTGMEKGWAFRNDQIENKKSEQKRIEHQEEGR